MDRRWYDDGRDQGGGLRYQAHHRWIDDGGGGGLQARREARNKLQGSPSVAARPSPTSVTSLFNMDESPSSTLFVDQSWLGGAGEGEGAFLPYPRGDDGPHTLNESGHHHGRPHLHDSLYQKQDDKDLKPRSIPSTPGAQQMSNSFDAVSRKLAAFDPAADGTTERRIEIAPGLTERLRGADETWQVIENDFYLPTQCFVCMQAICCIMDATYVLCPVCKVVSPMENGCDNGGVGLGFTNDNLQKWQTEIILSRRR